MAVSFLRLVSPPAYPRKHHSEHGPDYDGRRLGDDGWGLSAHRRGANDHLPAIGEICKKSDLAKVVEAAKMRKRCYGRTKKRITGFYDKIVHWITARENTQPRIVKGQKGHRTYVIDRGIVEKEESVVAVCDSGESAAGANEETDATRIEIGCERDCAGVVDRWKVEILEGAAAIDNGRDRAAGADEDARTARI